MNYWLSKKTKNNNEYSNYFYSLYDYKDTKNIIYDEDDIDLYQDDYYDITDITKNEQLVKFVKNTNQISCNFIYKLILFTGFNYDIPVVETNIINEGYYKNLDIIINKDEFYEFLFNCSN